MRNFRLGTPILRPGLRALSRLVSAVAGLYLLVAMAACAPKDGGWTVVTPAADSSGTPLHIVGVVKHLTLEGGVYTIVGEDGVTYNPTNLPAEFQKDGLRIEAEGKRRDDMMSIQMVGPMVQLERVRLRDAP
ncbi:MAG: hypothetical protein ABI877_11830 [Gemmatimonadaceae bacterium]